MDTLYTFWDNSTHYKTESVNFLGLMNSTAKVLRHGAVLTADGVESWAYFGHPCFCSVVFGYSGFRAWFLAYRFRAWALGFRV